MNILRGGISDSKIKPGMMVFKVIQFLNLLMR